MNRGLQAMVMILEVNFKGKGESLESFMNLREMIYIIEIKTVNILSLKRGR